MMNSSQIEPCKTSELQGKLMTFLEGCKSARLERVNTDSDEVSEIMRGYPYPISPWPIIVSKKVVAEFSEIVERVPKIFLAALDSYIGSNSEKASSYFCIPSYSYELLMSLKVGCDDFMIRHDFVYNKQNIRLIESNVGSTIGGWQHDWFTAEIKRQFEKYDELSSLNITRPNTFRAFFETLVYQVLKYKKSRNVITIVVPCLSGLGKKETVEAISKFCSFELNRAFANIEVRFEVIYSLDELHFSSSNYAFLNGFEVDALLFTVPKSADVTSRASTYIFNAAAENKLVFMDGLITSVFGNKAMYALLYESEVLDNLSDSDAEFVKRYFPWSYRMTEGAIDYQGKDHCKVKLTKRLKDKLILKKILSSQGEGIYVGSKMTAFEWEVAIETAVRSKDWIIQEYYSPDSELGCNNQGEIKQFEFVWGIFDLGGRYQGSFVRGSEVQENLGIINSATGALEFFVFEEEEKRTIISI